MPGDEPAGRMPGDELAGRAPGSRRARRARTADSPPLEVMHKTLLWSRAESCGDAPRFILYGCGMTMKQVPSVLPAGTADDATGATAAADGAARRALGATAAREAALVLAGAVAIALIGQIRLPLPFTPVPVTLGTLAVLGAGGLLGARRALASVALYAAAAALGAPVLAGWHSGMTASFGYVLGYGLAAVVAGAATAPRPASARGGAAAAAAVLRRAGLMVLASAVVYVPGLIWLKAATGAAWGATLAMGLAPFVVGDLLKSAVAALLPARRARG